MKTYYPFDKVGEAKVIHDYASDMPAINVNGIAHTRPGFMSGPIPITGFAMRSIWLKQYKVSNTYKRSKAA